MHIISTQQALDISGGCQKAIDKYEASTEFYSHVGTALGAAVGYTLSSPETNIPTKLLMGFLGLWAGSEAGYAFGAANYWTHRAVYRAIDSFAKPSL